MTDFFVFYTLANVVCFIIFGIMLVHDLIGMDRRETQIKYEQMILSRSVFSGPITTCTLIKLR